MIERDLSVWEPWRAEGRLKRILPDRLRGSLVGLEVKLLECGRHCVGCAWNAVNVGHARQAQCFSLLFYSCCEISPFE